MEINFEDAIVLEDEQGQTAPAAEGIYGSSLQEENDLSLREGRPLPDEAIHLNTDAATTLSKLLFTVNGDDYELVYTKLRIRHIEERLNMSIATIMAKIESGDLPKLADIYTIFAGGFKKVEGGYVSFEQGSKIAEQAIEDESYLRIIKYIIYALERDCPFLFRID